MTDARPAPSAALRAALYAAGLVAFASAWFFAREIFRGRPAGFGPDLLNKALAVSSLALVAGSMLLTGLARFVPRFRPGLARRKAYGLAGFALGALHALATHAFLAARPSGEIAGADHGGVMLGSATLFVLSAMALASNGAARRRLGGAAWRRFLRYAGYAALLLATAHAAVLKGASWARWATTFGTVLPSLSLPAVIIALAAIGLRVGMWAADRKKTD